MDLDQALAAHAEWKIRLRNAIATEATLDERTVGADNCCELGKWLHGEARRLPTGQGAVEECVTHHAQFHREAGRVAGEINARRFAEAKAMLESGGAYAAASSAVGTAIVRLKRALQPA